MAVRNPLYTSGGNLVEMTAGEINQWRTMAQFQFSQSTSVNLTVVSNSGANIDAMSDTRLQAGATSQSSSAFVAEGTTAEPSTVTVAFDKINLAYTATSGISNTTDTGTTFPVYYDSSAGAVRAMNLTDFLDTFIEPQVDNMISATESDATAGTFTIHTASTLSGYTEASGAGTAVFTDTIADTSAYASSGIPETLDQPSTVQNYFLMKRDGSDPGAPDRTPLFVDGSNNLQQFAASNINALLGNWLRFTAAHSSDGFKVLYTVGTSGSGNVRGSTMTDTKLNGNGNYQQRQVGDDYRSQEFPNGTAATISSFNLRINKS
jgi:hypothetical protein